MLLRLLLPREAVPAAQGLSARHTRWYPGPRHMFREGGGHLDADLEENACRAPGLRFREQLPAACAAGRLRRGAPVACVSWAQSREEWGRLALNSPWSSSH